MSIARSFMQYQLCKNYNLGVFFLKPTKGRDRHWESVKMLINNWEEIINLIIKDRLPFGYEIPARGKIRKL